ncbi:hypothetical protein DM02DRAFT_650090 [Periconia macrospinosa]|uniref:Uncharacterized protein n=1 Tax=Periconia macrospinosa TaxID=97972 RepID=A0A2V1E965_9PLEO|nr:hypothetical protein DM02DRAFT_650090 [Periconia macrospinosa]
MGLPQQHSSTCATDSSASRQHRRTRSSSFSTPSRTTNTTNTRPRSPSSSTGGLGPTTKRRIQAARNRSCLAKPSNNGIASRKPAAPDAATENRHQVLEYLFEGRLLVGMDAAIKKRQRGLEVLFKDVELLGVDSETIMAAGIDDKLFQDDTFNRFVTVHHLTLAREFDASYLCTRARAREVDGEKDELHWDACNRCKRAAAKKMSEKKTQKTTTMKTPKEEMSAEDIEEYEWRQRIEKWRYEVVPVAHGAEIWDLPSPPSSLLR